MFFRQIHKGGLELWQFVLTIILVITGYILGQVPLTIAISYYATRDGSESGAISEVIETLDFSRLGMSQNFVFFLMLIMFVVAMIALYLGIEKIHKRPFFSIWTGRSRVDFKRIIWGFLVWMLIAIGFELISYFLSPENYEMTFELSSFLPLLLIVLVLLPIQTTFEELFIRGYLMQAIGLMFSPRWVALLLTSIIFGLMHIMNPEVSEFGLGTMMIYYMGIALFLGIITLLDDGLELAIGIHAATNMFGALILNFDESAIKTPSIFKLLTVDAEFMTLFSFAGALLFFWVLHRKYGPFDWRRVFGTTQQDFDKTRLDVLNQEKMEAIAKSIPHAQQIEAFNLDGLEEDVSFFSVDQKGLLFVTERAAPFRFNGPVQKRFQLGYYELILAKRFQNIPDEDEHTPEYQSKIGRELRLLKAIARESHHRSFLSHKAYKMALEDGLMIYFVMQPFPSTDVHLIEGWPIGCQLVTEISAKQYELAKSQGGAVLIHELRKLAEFPFISNPESAL